MNVKKRAGLQTGYCWYVCVRERRSSDNALNFMYTVYNLVSRHTHLINLNTETYGELIYMCVHIYLWVYQEVG